MSSAFRPLRAAVALALCLASTAALANSTPQTLPFSQDWSDAGLITTANDWSGVPGIQGFRGDNVTTLTGADAQTLLAADDPGVLNVTANATTPNTNTGGGVFEFAITNPVVAMQGSGTADAPYLKLYLDTSGASGITVAYNVRDIDGSADNTNQQVALQYRVGNSGDFTNVPAAYIADATTGPSLATQVTAVSATLPVDADNKALVEVRILTTNASGSDEWVGIDDISVTAATQQDGLSVGDATILEGESGSANASVTISLVNPAPVGGVTFDVGTADDSATIADGDYTAVSLVGQVIPEGQKTLVVDIPVNGDTTIESDEAFFVNLSNVVGADVLDAQGVVTIDNDDFPILGIHEIQGNTNTSPENGNLVYTRGIVTAVRSNGFYLQTPDADVDADPATSQGIYVFTSSAPPAGAVVGNYVEVSGNVTEYTSSSNLNQLSLTEIVSPSVSVLSTGNSLPAPVALSATFPDPAGAPDQLERLEGMRVSIASLDVVAPGEGSITESAATSTANGNFFGVITGVARPFREPGVGLLDLQAVAGTVPRWDTNPERIRVQSATQTGATLLAVDVGATITGLVGVLDYGFSAYTLLTDPGIAANVTGGASPVAVPDAPAGAVTIGGFNLLRFYDDVNDAGGDVVLTTAAYGRRVLKTAGVICGYVKLPDILGVVEVENLNALNALATAINNNTPGNCAVNPQYVAYLVEGNDVGKINVGYLVSTREVSAGVPRVAVDSVVQYGKDTLLTNPNASTSILNDRPPLMLRATVNAADGADYDVTVIANHLRSLGGVNDTAAGTNGYSSEGARVRAKRAAQAAYLANLVEETQLAEPARHLVLLGDFNAFEFSDGYVDVMGIITGREAAESEVLNYVDSPVTSPLTNMTTLSPVADRYSFSFEGSAQVLDHIVVSQSLLDAIPTATTEHARVNADFGVDNFGDDAVPLRTSDHDPVVLVLPGAALATADLGVDVSADAASVYAGDDAGFDAVVSNDGPFAATDAVVLFTADAELPSLAVDAPAGFSCAAPVVGGGETTVECTAASVAVGNHAFVLTAGTNAGLIGDTVGLSADVGSATADDNSANDSDSAGTDVVAPIADLRTTVVQRPSSFVFGNQATASFRVQNLGPRGAQNARFVTSISAAGATVTPVAPAGWTCTKMPSTTTITRYRCTFAGELPSGYDGTLQFQVGVNRLTSVAAAGITVSDTIDPVSSNNSAVQVFTLLGLGWF